MHSNLIYSDCSKLIMCIDTELSQIKKFSEAYTILNDWQLETRYDNASPQNSIPTPPDFLNNACGVFELTSTIKISNNSAQNIINPNLIFMNSLLSSKKYHTTGGNYFVSFGNMDFIILSNDVLITTYLLDNNSNIAYNSKTISENDYENLIDLGSIHYANTTNTIVIKAKIYVMNCDIDTLPVDAFYSGKVGSLVKCSKNCIKQCDLPLRFDNSYSLVYSNC